MPSRREEKERLRQIREEAEKREASEQRRKLWVGYGVAGVLSAAVVLGIAVVVLNSSGGGTPASAHIDPSVGSTNGVEPDDREGTKPPPVRETDLRTAAREAGCTLGENLPDEGSQHLASGSPTPKYRTDPPTSGPHSEVPQADGAYSETPDPTNFLHSLEHSRIAIQYSPSLPERAQLQLKGVFDQSYSGSLLFPNDEMPYEVAVTSWRNLLGCRKYEGAKTLDAVRDFGRKKVGKGPEAVPTSGPSLAFPAGGGG